MATFRFLLVDSADCDDQEMNDRSPARVTLLGRTTFRNEGRLFGIRDADRLHHMLVIGRTGTGKSTLLASIARQDAEHGGLALLDPHGDLAASLVEALPPHRHDDLIYCDAASPSSPYGFNPLAGVLPAARSVAASGVLDTFRKLWPEFSGPRSDHLLRNALLTLLAQPEPTLANLLRLFDDAAYRDRAVARVANEQVRRFWLHEFAGYPARLKAESTAPLYNKVSAFLTDPVLNRVLTSARPLNLRHVMDVGKILVVNLSKGRLGSDSANLLGSLIISQLALAAMSRADTPETNRRAFHVVLDEFSSFTTTAFSGMLSELRKYACSLTLATQFLNQTDERVRAGILGNVGSIVAFRVGVEDAEVLAKEYFPEVGASDLVALPNYHSYVRLMVSGVMSRPFSARSLSPTRGTMRK